MNTIDKIQEEITFNYGGIDRTKQIESFLEKGDFKNFWQEARKNESFPEDFDKSLYQETDGIIFGVNEIKSEYIEKIQEKIKLDISDILLGNLSYIDENKSQYIKVSLKIGDKSEVVLLTQKMFHILKDKLSNEKTIKKFLKSGFPDLDLNLLDIGKLEGAGFNLNIKIEKKELKEKLKVLSYLKKKQPIILPENIINSINLLEKGDYFIRDGEKFYISKVDLSNIIIKKISDNGDIILSKINLVNIQTNKNYKWLKGVELFHLSKDERLTNLVSISNSIEEIIELLEEESKIGTHDSKYMISIIKEVYKGKKDGMYVTRTYGLREKISLLKNNKLIKETPLKDLWPKGLDHVTKQGYVGNCYFVNALNLVKSHPNGGNLLTKMVTIIGKNKWKVEFEGHDEEFIIILDDINNMGKSKIISKNIGDLIIERAHARYVNQVKKGRLQGHTILVDERGKLPHEGGYTKEVLDLFFGDKIEAEYIYNNSFDNFFQNYTDKDFLGLSSKRADGNSGKTYTAIGKNGKKIKLFYSHAYSISYLNKSTGVASIVNPHNSGEILYFKIEDIKIYFDFLVYGEFKKYS